MGFVAIALALLPAVCEQIVGIRIPWPMKFLITLTLVMHMAGGVFLFYFTFYPIYDKVCHFIAAMMITLLDFVSILVLGGLTNKISRGARLSHAHLSPSLFWDSWGNMHLRLDVISGSSYFLNPHDSVFDMIFNIIATAYMRANINEYLERESLLSLYPR